MSGPLDALGTLAGGGTLGGAATEAPVQCSAAGCRADAAWAVNWRNPRIHGLDRVKTWLACDAHRGSLGDYLATRGFPVIVTELGVAVDSVPDGSVP